MLPLVSSFIAASLKGMTRCAGNIAGILSELHINFRICFKDYLFETEVLNELSNLDCSLLTVVFSVWPVHFLCISLVRLVICLLALS